MFKEKENSKLILGSGIFIVLMAVITLSSTKLIGDTYAVKAYCPSGWADMGNGYCCRDNTSTTIRGSTCNVSTTSTVCSTLYNGTWNNSTKVCSYPARGARTYYLSLNPNGGSFASGVAPTRSCYANSQQSYCVIRSVPKPSRPGYTFKGYGASPSCTSGSSSNITMTSDKTLYACWRAKQPSCEYTTARACTVATGSASCAKDSNGCYVPVRKYTATLQLNGGSIDGNSSNRTLVCTSKNNKACRITYPDRASVKKSGYTFNGWVSNKDGERNYYYDDLSGNETYTASWVVNKPTNSDYEQNTTTSSGGTTTTINENNQGGISGGTTEDNKQIIFVTQPTHINYYKITYDLDGGEFIDGTTTRTEIVQDRFAIGALQTNPIKKGYKFVEWQLNGETFDFSTKANSDITLKAVYTEFEDYDNYECEDGYSVFDPASKACYKVLKPDNSNTYNYTQYTYNEGAQFCWGNYTKEDSSGDTIYVLNGSSEPYTAYTGTGALSFVSNVSSLRTDTGKQGLSYAEYGYNDQESWLSQNTCTIGKECTDNKDWRSTSACIVRYDAIVFSSTAAKEKDNSNEDMIVDGDDNTNNNQNNQDENVDTNVKTGDAFIIIISIIAVLSIAAILFFTHRNKKLKSTKNV